MSSPAQQGAGVRTNGSKPSGVPEALTYVPGRDRNEAWAHFEGAKPVRLERGRARSYPGLVTEAPPTQAYYRYAAHLFSGARRVLDVGCGAGSGLAILSGAVGAATGIDLDPTALLFARHLAPGATVLRADAAAAAAEGGFDGATLVDVLGQVRSPFEVLRSARNALGASSRVLVAEPRACSTQQLRPPARRSFSPRALGALVAAAGFDVDEWLEPSGSFVICVAHPRDDDGPAELLAGARAVARGDAKGALDAYALAARSSDTHVRLEAALAEGDLRMSCGDGDGAAEAYMRAGGIGPKDPRPFAGLAQLSLAMGDHEVAHAFARRALELDPTDPSAACAHAVTLPESAVPQVAEAWRVANALLPDHAGVAAQFARVAVQSGDPEHALFALERCRGYGDEVGLDFHVALALALRAAGRPSDAALEVRLAEALDPSNPEVVALRESLRGPG